MCIFPVGRSPVRIRLRSAGAGPVGSVWAVDVVLTSYLRSRTNPKKPLPGDVPGRSAVIGGSTGTTLPPRTPYGIIDSGTTRRNPPEVRMWAEIKVARDVWIAEAWRELLENQGIPCLIWPLDSV